MYIYIYIYHIGHTHSLFLSLTCVCMYSLSRYAIGMSCTCAVDAGDVRHTHRYRSVLVCTQQIAEAEAMIKLSHVLVGYTRQLMTVEFKEFEQPTSFKAYTTVIKRPMDLKTILDKAERYAYSSRHPWAEVYVHLSACI